MCRNIWSEAIEGPHPAERKHTLESFTDFVSMGTVFIQKAVLWSMIYRAQLDKALQLELRLTTELKDHKQKD